MSRHLVHLLLAVPVAGLLGSTAVGQVVYVDADASGANDGSTWADAFTELSTALSSGAGLELWVAEGRYLADPAGTDRDATFALSAGIEVYGGFDGTETQRDQRDPDLHPTTLDADLLGDDAPNWVNYTDNTFHVVTFRGDATLDGFLVRGGNAFGAALGFGGGIVIESGAAIVRNCEVDECVAGGASGINLRAGTLELEGCTVSRNLAHYGRGGGLRLDPGTAATVRDSAFIDNDATGAGILPGAGGAIYVSLGRLEVFGTLFEGNTSRLVAGGANNANVGGAICCISNDRLVLQGCRFVENECEDGGALWISHEVLAVNCLFQGNKAHKDFERGGRGGAATVVSPTDVHFVHCTFEGNWAAEDAGGIDAPASTPIWVENCVLWGNTDPKNRLLKQQIRGSWEGRNSVIQGLLEPEPGEDAPEPDKWPGCLDLDPRYVDAAAGDLRLAAGSPAIDAGDGATLPPGVLTDLEGLSRTMDDPGSADRGGPSPAPDMGCHEFQGQTEEFVLQPQPTIAVVGESELSLRSSAGLPSTPSLLFAVAVDGTPFSWLVARGTCDSTGAFELRAPVPVLNGLAGTEITFQSFGLHWRTGEIVASDPQPVHFVD